VADESGFAPDLDGYQTADGRSSRGAIRIAGGYQAPIEQITCTYYATPEMVRLFDWLKRVQDSSDIPITLQDWTQKITQIPGQAAPSWLPGSPVTGSLGIPEGYQAFVVWIDTDQGYKPYSSGNCLSVLQFQALREG
jgi:hypothetical protein